MQQPDAGPIVVPFRSNAPWYIPYTRTTFRGTSGARTEWAMIDTGVEDYLWLSGRTTRRVRPWRWSEPFNRVRGWSAGTTIGTWSVCESVQLGDATAHDVPALVPLEPSDSPVAQSILGRKFLSIWRSAEFRWSTNELVLRLFDSPIDAPGESSASVVPFRYWSSLGLPDQGHIAVVASVDEVPTEFIIDTGYGMDLVIPASLLDSERWRGKLVDDGAQEVETLSGVYALPRKRFTGRLTIAGREFTDLRAVIDTSTPPRSMNVRPVLGAPFLNRFDRFVIDFDDRRVLLD